MFLFFRQDPDLIRQSFNRKAGLTGLLLAVVVLSPAPDLKLPSLPGFFKRAGNDLQETVQAPTGPGAMCVLPSGDYVISCHQFFYPTYRVMRLDSKEGWMPFPNIEMNTPGSAAPVILDSVLGVACDSRGIVWMLDNGRRSDTPPKLVAWDTKRNQLHQVIVINSQALSSRSFLRNLVLDPVDPFIYISDPADGISSAIIVVNTATGLTRRVLQGHRSTQMEPNIVLELDGRSITVRRPDGELATPLTGVSPIAIDRKGDWLYYGPRNGSSLFRIQTDLLQRQDVSAAALESQVSGVSPKPICDSMIIDSKGRVYFGDISRGSIDYVSPEDSFLNLRLLIQDPRLIWPGGLIIAPDGNLHFFSNQLHRTSFFNGGKDVTAPPFSIFKARPLPATRFGF
ncbi:MAG: L-dopachrome tautomerase-related protein [Verrucomicrobiales bacterium]|nr:L-dopachrome tautomerase-related protein [Verrucomicrobiales bacterium]